VSPGAPTSATALRLWFAVLGAPAAWAFQFAAGYWVSQERCSPPGEGWGVAADVWAIALTVVAGAIALAAWLTAAALLRATAEAGVEDAPPPGRVRFLATVGLAVTPLFACIIAMNAVGVLVLSTCHQS
jgi:hypothetical protein